MRIARTLCNHECDQKLSSPARRFYRARAEEEHSPDRVAELALWMRSVLTWQDPRASWRWLGGGVYGVMVVREVAARLAAINPMSLVALGGVVVLLGDHAAAVLPLARAMLATPGKVRRWRATMHVRAPNPGSLACSLMSPLHCRAREWVTGLCMACTQMPFHTGQDRLPCRCLHSAEQASC
jgi:hypothetical protein